MNGIFFVEALGIALIVASLFLIYCLVRAMRFLRGGVAWKLLAIGFLLYIPRVILSFFTDMYPEYIHVFEVLRLSSSFATIFFIVLGMWYLRANLEKIAPLHEFSYATYLLSVSIFFVSALLIRTASYFYAVLNAPLFWGSSRMFLLIAVLMFTQALRRIYIDMGPTAVAATERKEWAREDLHTLSIYTDLTNRLLANVNPLSMSGELGRNAVNECALKNNILKGCEITESGALNTDAVAESLTGMGENAAIASLFDAFSALNEKLVDIIAAVTSRESALMVAMTATEATADLSGKAVPLGKYSEAIHRQLYLGVIEAKEYLDNLIENSPDAVIVTDMEGRVLAFNRAAEEITDYPTVETLGTSEEHFFVDSEEHEGFMERVMREGKVKNYRAKIKRKEGLLAYLSLSAALLHDKDKNPIGLVMMGKDITKEVEMEDALRESEAQKQALLDGSTDALIQIGTNMKILWANKTALDMNPDAIGQTCHKAFIGVDEPCEDCPCKKAIDTGQSEMGVQYQPVVAGVQGESYWEVIGVPMKDRDGKVVGVIEIARNITERKRAEEEREMLLKDLEETNKKLARSNKELQDFVYVASHDLKEPVRKVSAFGNLLRESLAGRLDEDERENFEFMIDGATRMLRMVDDLLVYSRVTTRAKPAERVDLNGVIENLKNVELAIKVEETGGVIEVPEPLPAVYADRSQMHQLLQNLIGNGLKYHRKDMLPVVTIRGKEDGNRVRIEVQDNGIGISEENHDKIFKMFQRLHSREDYEGTGIGLAVCKKIVDRHEGSIGVKSTPGEGSTFWVTLPMGGNEERGNATYT